MASDPSDLRELYEQGERDAILRSLAPNLPESDIDNFRKGLRYSMEHFELLEELITTAFERSGLSEFDTLEDPEALIRLNTAIRDCVEWLTENVPTVPDWFTTRWCEHIIERLWKKRLLELAAKRAKIREGKKPQTASNTSEASALVLLNADIPLHTGNRQGLASLQYMNLKLTILDNKRDTNTSRFHQIAIKRCFLAGRPSYEFASYSYKLFITEMQTIINDLARTSDSELVDLGSGTVGYSNQDGFFRSITRQQGFEIAIESLWTARGSSIVLPFFFRKESSAERNVRIDATLSTSTSPVSPRTPLFASFGERDPNRVLWRASKLRSPPPTPAPQGPLPPIPSASSAMQVGLLNTRNLTQEQKDKIALSAALQAKGRTDATNISVGGSMSSSPGTVAPQETRLLPTSNVAGAAQAKAGNSASAAQGNADAVTVIEIGSTSSSPGMVMLQEKIPLSISNIARAAQTRADAVTVMRESLTSSPPLVMKPTFSGNETRASLAGSTVSDTNKPLPPVPGGKPKYSHTVLSVLHNPTYSNGGGPPLARKLQKPNTSLPRPSQNAPVIRAQRASPSTPEPVVRKPFLTKGGGMSKSATPSPGPSHGPSRTQIPRPPRVHGPPPVSEQAKRAWRRGNKSSPVPNRVPIKGTPPGTRATPLKPKIVDIKRGRKSEIKVPSDVSIGSKASRLITPGPFLRDKEARRHAEVIARNAERAERNRSWSKPRERASLSDPEDDRDRPPNIIINHPKKPTILGVAFSKTKKRMSTLLSPRRPDSQETNGDVEEMIDQDPKPGEALTPPSTGVTGDPETPKRVSFNLTRVTTALANKQVVIDPGRKKTLGLVKVPGVRIITTMDKFENQDRRYPRLYTEVERRTFRRGGDEYVEPEINVFSEDEDATGGERFDEGESGDEEDQKKPGEYMVEQFQKMQNMPELTQMHAREGASSPSGSGPWEECCELFQIDPIKTSIDERVLIAGIKTPMYQYQAFGVYWQMRNSRYIGGGFVADEMGLGKTLSFLAYIVVERQLSFLSGEIRASRNKQEATERTHLQPGEAGSGAVCPSKDRYGPGWIACPCASSLTASLVPKPGVRLAILPPSLVPTWIEQWDAHIDVTNTNLAMTLVIAHDGSNPPTADGRLDVRDGRHPAVVKRVQANRTKYSGKGHTDGQHFYPDYAQFSQERVLVVTTHDHYVKTWSTKFQYLADVLPEDKDDRKSVYKGMSPGVVYGIAMIDECHEDWQKNKGRSALVASLPKAGRPFVWGYSGTPLTTTPRSIEGVLWAIESLWPKRNRADKTLTGLEQEQDSDLWKFCWKKLNILCQEFESEVKKGTDDQIIFRDFYLRFKPFLTALMLRRTTDTAWFGQPLIKLMPHIHQDVILSHNPEYDPKIDQFRWAIDEEIENRLIALRHVWSASKGATSSTMPIKFSFNTDIRLRYKQRLFATFPYLAVLGAQFHPDHLDLTVEELKKFRGKDEKNNRNPYFKHLRKITEKSPKVMWLYNFIAELDKTIDVHGEEQKIVILSEYNQVAFIIKLWIEKHIKNKAGRVGIIYAGQKPSVRKATIEAFTDAKDNKKARKQKANYQFLVGTTRIIGAGLQLTRSCNVVLMEPDYEFHRELQGYARIHRIGQRNPESHSYRLIDAIDEIEQSLVKRQRARGEFPGRPDRIEDSDEGARGAAGVVDDTYADADAIYAHYSEEAEYERLCTESRTDFDQSPENVRHGKDVAAPATMSGQEASFGQEVRFRQEARYDEEERVSLDSESKAILDQFPAPGGFGTEAAASRVKKEEDLPQENVSSAH